MSRASSNSRIFSISGLIVHLPDVQSAGTARCQAPKATSLVTPVAGLWSSADVVTQRRTSLDQVLRPWPLAARLRWRTQDMGAPVPLPDHHPPQTSACEDRCRTPR